MHEKIKYSAPEITGKDMMRDLFGPDGLLREKNFVIKEDLIELAKKYSKSSNPDGKKWSVYWNDLCRLGAIDGATGTVKTPAKRMETKDAYTMLSASCGFAVYGMEPDDYVKALRERCCSCTDLAPLKDATLQKARRQFKHLLDLAVDGGVAGETLLNTGDSSEFRLPAIAESSLKERVPERKPVHFDVRFSGMSSEDIFKFDEIVKRYGGVSLIEIEVEAI